MGTLVLVIRHGGYALRRCGVFDGPLAVHQFRVAKRCFGSTSSFWARRPDVGFAPNIDRTSYLPIRGQRKRRRKPDPDPIEVELRRYPLVDPLSSHVIRLYGWPK